jgi:hypothetical protein
MNPKHRNFLEWTLISVVAAAIWFAIPWPATSAQAATHKASV